jgi:molecular chaperone DnaJ
VETPTKLSSKQKDLLEQFRATETGECNPQSEGFFQKMKSAWS